MAIPKYKDFMKTVSELLNDQQNHIRREIYKKLPNNSN